MYDRQNDPGLPLPAAVLARLRTAETLRAELAGMTAERDALREQVDALGWERDTAQNEAAFLRDEVLNPRDWRRPILEENLPQTVGLLLTTGDEPPAPPEDANDDIALVSLSTGRLYVRHPRAPEQWMEYGQDSSTTDWATMGERGPWVSVQGPTRHSHEQAAAAKRRLNTILWDARGVGQAPWPDDAQHAIEAVRALSGDSIFTMSKDPSDYINAWQRLAGSVRSAWEEAVKSQRDAFDPEHIPLADGYSREDFGTPDEVRGWNLCREYVVGMYAENQPVIPAKNEATR